LNRLRRVETFARLGYLARGIVYILLGYLALASSRSKSPTNVLGEIKDSSFGTPALVIVGIGLALYGLYRLNGAALNIDGHQRDLVGSAKRIGHGASGLAHLGLGFIAGRAALAGDAIAKNGGGEKTQEAASFLMTLPGGDIILALIGLGFLAAALDQGKKAWTGEYMDELAADTPDAVKYVGFAGHAARTVVFAIIGWNIGWSAISGNASEVGGVGLALDKLREHGTAFTIVAIGLFLFGIFSVVTARYRTIRDEDVIARLKREMHG